jgi:endonuclease/exonuclease/phosphatase family metal-dependent hydrolase
MSLSLLTLNIERNNHWNKVLPLLQAELPDVLCIQELFEKDMHIIESLGYQGEFAFVATKFYDYSDPSSGTPQGIGIFSKLPINNFTDHALYTAPYPSEVQTDDDHIDGKRATTDLRILSAQVEKDGEAFTIATTHFTWTPRGDSSHYQVEDMTNLIAYVKTFPELILCGDFNIPRGINEQYDRLAECLIDTIPKTFTTSMDISIHRKGHIPERAAELSRNMVDYIFTTPHYIVENIQVRSGVSDHFGFLADVRRV